MNLPELVTRKESAAMLGISLSSFDRNAERLGLDRARIRVNARVIRFRRDDVLAIISGQCLQLTPTDSNSALK